MVIHVRWYLLCVPATARHLRYLGTGLNWQSNAGRLIDNIGLMTFERRIVPAEVERWQIRWLAWIGVGMVSASQVGELNWTLDYLLRGGNLVVHSNACACLLYRDGCLSRNRILTCWILFILNDS